MSTISIPSPTHPIDHFGRQIVDAFAAPFNMAKDATKAFAPGEYIPKTFTNDTPTILKLAHQVIDLYGNYHTNVINNSIEYATRIENLVEKVIKWPLTPLTYTQTGTSIQNLLCRTLIGTIVFATVFCALQVFHIIPTIVTAIVISSTLFFYHAAPVALITTLTASILLLIGYGVYFLTGEVRVGNKTLKQGFDQAQKKILEIQTQVNTLEKVVLHTIVPTVKMAGYAVLALSIPSTVAVSILAYNVLTKGTV